jgi:hypothetical protein
LNPCSRRSNDLHPIKSGLATENPVDPVVARLKQDAQLRVRGNRYEDFEPGLRFTHHWGRTVTAADNTMFSVLTLHYNPQYTNDAVAQANGYAGVPLNPLLVFNTVFGLSVEDLSEGGGPFLAWMSWRTSSRSIPARRSTPVRRSSRRPPATGPATAS